MLKDKKILFATWGSERKDDAPYQNWYLPIKDIFSKVVVFDPSKEYFRYGKDAMNNKFLNLVGKEKPDYLFMLLMYDEFYLETLDKIRKISPNTIMVNLFSDDDWRYEEFSRYYGLFFDYCIIQHDVAEKYASDGIKGVKFIVGVNSSLFKPIKAKKKYNISFYGRPNPSRIDYLGFLIKKGLDVHIWGDGWGKYSIFGKYYHGRLNAEDLPRVISESKINLGFTLGSYGQKQTKGKPFEIPACKSFLLIEHFDRYFDFFKRDELITFSTKEDLVKKINYYLKNEKEREEVANKAYQKVIKYYDQKVLLENFFTKSKVNKNKGINFNQYNKKIINLKIEDLEDSTKLLNLIKDKKYISIIEDSKFHPLKNYFQARSLDLSGKDISCCDYYVNSSSLGNYILFKAGLANKKVDINNFHKMIFPSQLMFRKTYFVKNMHRIKAFIAKKTNLIENNAVFVSIPLVQTSKLPDVDFENLSKSTQMKFIDKLYSLHYQKKLLFGLYPYSLMIKSIKNNFIIRSLYKSIRDTDKLNKLKNGA